MYFPFSSFNSCHGSSKMVIVTDGEREECMDPGGNGAILNVGEDGGPCLPRGEGKRQLALDSGGS